MTRRLAGLLGLVLALTVAPAAGAPSAGGDPCGPAPLVGQPFGANTNRTGLVDLHFFNADGAPVTYYECVDGRSLLLGRRVLANGAITSMWGATVWRCGRLTRRFAATATLPDGTHVRGVTGVRTPSCARRFRLEAPRTAAAGRSVRLRVVDRWGTGGLHATLCLTAPGARRSRCRAVAFAPAATVATRRFTPRARGRWRADLRVRRFHVRATIAVGVPGRSSVAAPPTVLATGDSTMQGVDSFLADDLGERATVVSDVRPGFAMSMADGWAAVAAAQAARVRPAVTVMSLGAAEGFPMTGADGRRHACCDPQWVDEYVRRVGRVMDTYRRHGRRVLWLTVVAPRDAPRAAVVSAVNTAILRAAAGRARVRVLRMDRLFSPHGYQDTIRYRGRDVRVREPDGIHLNVSGTAIAARVVARALRLPG